MGFNSSKSKMIDYVVKDYDPNQPRDDHGRWTSAGGSSGSSNDNGRSDIMKKLGGQGYSVNEKLQSHLDSLVNKAVDTMGDDGDEMDPDVTEKLYDDACNAIDGMKVNEAVVFPSNPVYGDKNGAWAICVEQGEFAIHTNGVEYYGNSSDVAEVWFDAVAM